MVSEPAFCRAFIAEAKRLLAEHPQVPHAWTIAPDESSCTLVIPKTDEKGFDITFAAELEEFDLTCGGFWASDAREEGSIEDFAGHCVGLLYDLLTSLMRVASNAPMANPTSGPSNAAAATHGNPAAPTPACSSNTGASAPNASSKTKPSPFARIPSSPRPPKRNSLANSTFLREASRVEACAAPQSSEP
jgi:hypothetical protein